MAAVKLAEIMARLLAKARKGEVDWESTSRRHEYATVVGTSSITIAAAGFEDEDVFIRVLNASGEEVESSLMADRPSRDLFELARTTALKTDETLDEILRELE